MTATAAHVAADAPAPLLHVSGLSVGFGPVAALIDAELTIGPGELVALAGEPGAGAVTLDSLVRRRTAAGGMR